MEPTFTRVYLETVSGFLLVPVKQLSIRGVYTLDTYAGRTVTAKLSAENSDGIVVDVEADFYAEDERNASPTSLLALLVQGPDGVNFTESLRGELLNQVQDEEVKLKLPSLRVQSLSVLFISTAPSSSPTELWVQSTRSPSTKLQAVLGDSLKGLTFVEVTVVVVLTVFCCLCMVAGIIWASIRYHRRRHETGKIAKYPALDAVAHRLDIGTTRVLFGRAPTHLRAIDDDELQRDLNDPEKWLGAARDAERTDHV